MKFGGDFLSGIWSKIWSDFLSGGFLESMGIKL